MQVFRMIARANHRERRARSGFKLVNAINFFGPRRLVRRRIEREAACQAETLGSREKSLAAPQLLLDALAVLDVVADAVPADHRAGLVAHRHAMAHHPSIRSIIAANA